MSGSHLPEGPPPPTFNSAVRLLPLDSHVHMAKQTFCCKGSRTDLHLEPSGGLAARFIYHNLLVLLDALVRFFYTYFFRAY